MTYWWCLWAPGKQGSQDWPASCTRQRRIWSEDKFEKGSTWEKGVDRLHDGGTRGRDPGHLEADHRPGPDNAPHVCWRRHGSHQGAQVNDGRTVVGRRRSTPLALDNVLYATLKEVEKEQRDGSEAHRAAARQVRGKGWSVPNQAAWGNPLVAPQAV